MAIREFTLPHQQALEGVIKDASRLSQGSARGRSAHPLAYKGDVSATSASGHLGSGAPAPVRLHDPASKGKDAHDSVVTSRAQSGACKTRLPMAV